MVSFILAMFASVRKRQSNWQDMLLFFHFLEMQEIQSHKKLLPKSSHLKSDSVGSCKRLKIRIILKLNPNPCLKILRSMLQWQSIKIKKSKMPFWSMARYLVQLSEVPPAMTHFRPEFRSTKLEPASSPVRLPIEFVPSTLEERIGDRATGSKRKSKNKKAQKARKKLCVENRVATTSSQLVPPCPVAQ